MTVQKPIVLLALFTGSALLLNSTKTADVSYDAYFWSATDSKQENTTLYVDGIKHGSLVVPSTEEDSTIDNPIIDQLISLQLSQGIHRIAVKNSYGEVINAGTIEIKTNGITVNGEIGEIDVQGTKNRLSVKISY